MNRTRRRTAITTLLLSSLSMFGSPTLGGAQGVPEPPQAASPTLDIPAPPPASPQAPPTITADTLLGFLQREAPTGACALSTTFRVGGRLAIACGPTGVWIVEISPNGTLSLITRQYLGAPVLRLFEGGGRLWAELQGGAAVPVDTNATTASAPPVAPQPVAPPATAPTFGTTPDLPFATEPSPASVRVGDVWEVSGTVRPFLALETLGGGVLLDASVGRRFEAPLHVWAMLQPLALATGRQGGTSPFIALLLASYDTRNFEIGLGFGGQSINATDGDFVDSRPLGPGSGFSISQFARLGRRDGLSVSLRTDVTLFHSAFKLSSAFVQGQIPLRGEEGLWIVINGGGGTTGYALGEVGLRTRVSGDNGAGSVFLTVTVGGTSVFSTDVSSECDASLSSHCSFDYSGPLLGIGSEWRL